MITLSKERKDLFGRLSGMVGNTPLYEVRNIPIPNGCRIFCKEEFRNPTGSHYDRFWSRYFYVLERDGFITEENKHNPIIETTTGNSGASFAWFCRMLGYTDCRVVIPKDMPDIRKKQITRLNPDPIVTGGFKVELIESEEKQYVRGVIDKFNEYCGNPTNGIGFVKPNHAAKGDSAIDSMEKLADEIIADLEKIGIRKVNHFVSALGNGISTKGVGRVLKKKYGTKIIGVEPKECSTFYHTLHNEAWPQYAEFTHKMYGSGTGDCNFRFPILRGFVGEMADIQLVSEDDWKQATLQLEDREGKFVGHTSAACFSEALRLASNTSNKGSIIVIIFYDSDWKYLE